MSASFSYLPPGFETAQQAHRRRDSLIRILASRGKDHQALAHRLAACKKGARCESAACPSCVRLERRRFLKQGTQVLASRSDWVRASLIPAKLAVPKGNLTKLDLNKIVRTTQRRLQRCAATSDLVLGGVDFSLNVGPTSAMWQPHLYLLIAGTNTTTLQKDVRAAFPPETTAARPFHFTKLYSFAEPLSYVMKPYVSRRSAYEVDGRARVRHQSLSGDETAEYALFIDRYPLGAQLILRGVRRAGHRVRTPP